MTWLLYGATGYTGELIARAAVARNQRPVLAGRNAAAVERLAKELGCKARVFPLDRVEAIAGHLEGVRLVLNCAGPFSATARPMMRACLATRAHYLDITGEIEVFELGHSFDAEARRANAVVCPGVGFDVVPSDCLAAKLKEALPTATHLALGFDSRSPPSRGTAKTMIESLRSGSQVRTDGRIVAIPFASRVREIDFGEGKKKLAIAIPWGDVSTAFYTTGIPNIEVYIPASPGTVRRMQRLNRWRWLAGSAPAQWWLKRRISQAPPGPDAEQRERTPVWLWGEVRDSSRTAVGRMRVANGYTVTVHAALGIVDRVLRGPVSAGFRTASQLVGADFAAQLPGSTPVELRRD